MKTTVRKADQVITFKITSFNSAAKKCNVTVICDSPVLDVPKILQYRNVKVSHLLAWKLNNRPDIVEVGKTYTSGRLSDNWTENPLQLIDMLDKDGGVFHLLACVEEKSPRKVVDIDIMGDETLDYVNRYWKKSEYDRYRMSKALKEAKMAERQKQTA